MADENTQTPGAQAAAPEAAPVQAPAEGGDRPEGRGPRGPRGGRGRGGGDRGGRGPAPTRGGMDDHGAMGSDKFVLPTPKKKGE